MAIPVSGPVRLGLTWALNVVLPPRCLACGALVETPGRLCGACWRKVDFIHAPQCDVCGLPFEQDPGPGAICGACAARRPPFARARAAMGYGGVSRDLVLGFKHGDQTHAAPGLARFMANAAGELLEKAEVCVPVPLHRWRLARRRFNQAGLLAAAIGRLGGVPVFQHALIRARRTHSQGGLSRTARARNVRGAFRVRPSAGDDLADRAVLLVDDVFTTGATVAECTRILRRSGARSVDVLTLARVLREGADGQTEPVTRF